MQKIEFQQATCLDATNPSDLDATPALMREIDRDYRAVTGFSTPGQYKIFYSRIDPCPLLVLGQNPGGAEDGPSLVASASFFENWEHDIPRFRNDPRYSLARPLYDLLSAALDTRSVDVIRQVPMTNVIFRRSRDTQSLSMDPRQAALEAKPFLSRIITAVQPRAILLISSTAYSLFTKLHCKPATVTESKADAVFTPNGRSPAQIFRRADALVESVGRTMPLLMVGHPSKYGSRGEWRQVTLALAESLAALRMTPSTDGGLARDLPPLAGY